MSAFMIRLWNHDDEQSGWPAAFVYTALDLHDRFFALYQFLIKARAFSFKQQIARQGQSIKLRSSSRGDLPSEGKRRHRSQPVEEHIGLLSHRDRFTHIH